MQLGLAIWQIIYLPLLKMMHVKLDRYMKKIMPKNGKEGKPTIIDYQQQNLTKEKFSKFAIELYSFQYASRSSGTQISVPITFQTYGPPYCT